jgi:hypothetical protein
MFYYIMSIRWYTLFRDSCWLPNSSWEQERKISLRVEMRVGFPTLIP